MLAKSLADVADYTDFIIIFLRNPRNQREKKNAISEKKTRNMNENDITYKIRGAIFKVYNELGPGLLESVYEAALLYQLRKDGLQVESQKKLDVYYDGHLLPVDFRLDIIVEDKVIIELKSVEMLKDVHKKQLLTYLKISGRKVGLLVNFNTSDITKDIVRIVNGL
jgi:GxxExxY protein